MKSDLTRLENKSTYVDLKMTQTKLKNSLYGRNFGHVIFSVSVKDIFQKVTDAWFLKFVRQRENCQSQWLPVLSVLESHCTPPIPIKTRKLSYRKDDCAMRHMYGCTENFWQYLSMPTATFPEIFNVLLFLSILWMRVQNSEVRSFTRPFLR